MENGELADERNALHLAAAGVDDADDHANESEDVADGGAEPAEEGDNREDSACDGQQEQHDALIAVVAAVSGVRLRNQRNQHEQAEIGQDAQETVIGGIRIENLLRFGDRLRSGDRTVNRSAAGGAEARVRSHFSAALCTKSHRNNLQIISVSNKFQYSKEGRNLQYTIRFFSP